MKWLVGIDEVGRGPLAGPVTVCALLVSKSALNKLIGHSMSNQFGVANFDSKKVSKKKRKEITRVLQIMRGGRELDFAICSVSARVVDKQGIVNAVNLAIARALKRLSRNSLSVPSAKLNKMQVLLDGGLRAPREYRNQKTIIRGDSSEAVIGLASILAKVHRDKYMARIHNKYPDYAFDKHVGYGTRAHYKALTKYGPSPLHRLSFLKVGSSI